MFDMFKTDVRLRAQQEGGQPNGVGANGSIESIGWSGNLLKPQPLCRQKRFRSGRGRWWSWWTSSMQQWPSQNETWPVQFGPFLGKEMPIWNPETAGFAIPPHLKNEFPHKLLDPKQRQ